MTTRLNEFHELKNHAWFGKTYKKLKQTDIEIAENFIIENDLLNKGKFEMKLLRHFVDIEKPKKWKEIEDLVLAANHITNDKGSL